MGRLKDCEDRLDSIEQRVTVLEPKPTHREPLVKEGDVVIVESNKRGAAEIFIGTTGVVVAVDVWNLDHWDVELEPGGLNPWSHCRTVADDDLEVIPKFAPGTLLYDPQYGLDYRIDADGTLQYRSCSGCWRLSSRNATPKTDSGWTNLIPRKRKKFDESENTDDFCTVPNKVVRELRSENATRLERILALEEKLIAQHSPCPEWCREGEEVQVYNDSCAEKPLVVKDVKWVSKTIPGVDPYWRITMTGGYAGDVKHFEPYVPPFAVGGFVRAGHEELHGKVGKIVEHDSGRDYEWGIRFRSSVICWFRTSDLIAYEPRADEDVVVKLKDKEQELKGECASGGTDTIFQLRLFNKGECYVYILPIPRYAIDSIVPDWEE